MVTTNLRFDHLFIINVLVAVLNVTLLSVFHSSTNPPSCFLAGHALSYGPVFISTTLERLQLLFGLLATALELEWTEETSSAC